MSHKIPSVYFPDFVEKFSIVELPIILSPESQIEFSRENEPLHPLEIEQYIGEVDSDNHEEVIACFRIPETGDFVAIVYWRAKLLVYEYILATYSLKGELISQKVIAGMKAVDETVKQRAVTLDEEWTIYMIDSIIDSSNPIPDVSESKTKTFELQETGDILEF